MLISMNHIYYIPVDIQRDPDDPPSVTFLGNVSVVGSTICEDFRIIDNNVVELNRVFSVALDTTIPEGVGFSEPNSTTVTILDNDGELIYYLSICTIPQALILFHSCKSDVCAACNNCE